MTTGRPIGRRGVGGNVKKINGEWLKAVDSKSTVPLWYRGVRIPPSPSCTIDVYPLWSGAGIETGEVRERSNRRAWRARGRQKCPVGSNPTLSAQAGGVGRAGAVYKMVVVLGGEVAVPCNPQAAIAGLNSHC